MESGKGSRIPPQTKASNKEGGEVIKRKCSIEGCEGVHRAGGFCSSHYNKLKRHGSPDVRKRVWGQQSHPLYCTFNNMHDRCRNPSNSNYNCYGARGIQVCDRWSGIDGFSHFVADMGLKPTARHSIDRIDNDKGYSPENCRWATRHEQCANRQYNNQVVGVSYAKRSDGWVARLRVQGALVLNRHFKSYEAAVAARKQAEAAWL